MSDAVLTLNAGSSSLKFALFRAHGDAILRGQVEGIGVAPHLIVREAQGGPLAEHRWPAGEGLDHESFLDEVFALVDRQLGLDCLCAIGHRVVHGGSRFSAPVRVDDAVLAALDSLSPMAPLHQPHNLAAVRAAIAARPDTPQVACFDTAFHHGHSSLVTRYALPRSLHHQGVRRYGFHGLSYAYVSERLRTLDPALARGRVIIAHLGNGASLCAVRDGASVDTTMGFSTLDGLIMGTRCGALDPGVVLYLEQQMGMSAAQVQSLLYERSGLLGVSGVSGDMRILLASPEPEAKEAIDLFTFRIVREAGALMATMEGLDGFVFTGGIGENAPAIRAAVAERLGWAGLVLDRQANGAKANRAGAGLISGADSRVRAWVVATDEESMIARHAADAVSGQG